MNFLTPEDSVKEAPQELCQDEGRARIVRKQPELRRKFDSALLIRRAVRRIACKIACKIVCNLPDMRARERDDNQANSERWSSA
jgi:hypothetical protein